MKKKILTIYTLLLLFGTSIANASQVEEVGPILLENVTLSCKKVILYTVSINLGLVSFSYEKTKLICNNGWESEPVDNFWN